MIVWNFPIALVGAQIASTPTKMPYYLLHTIKEIIVGL